MRLRGLALLAMLFPLLGRTSTAAPADSGFAPPDGTAGSLYSLDLESLLKLKVSTASKFSEDLSGAPGVVSVVTRDELDRFGGTTLKEVLERVPGLFDSTDSFTDRSIISIRGDQTRSNSGHVLYLINGRPTREVLEGGIATDLLEAFPVAARERIEVIKGPGSVLYGSNAFSGVINLITREANGNRLDLKVLSAGGANASTSGSFSVRRGELGIFGAGDYHSYPQWPVYYRNSYFGNANVTVPSRSDGAYMSLTYGGFRAMSSWTEHRTAYVEGSPGQALWRRGFADAGYELNVKPNWQMNFNPPIPERGSATIPTFHSFRATPTKSSRSGRIRSNSDPAIA